MQKPISKRTVILKRGRASLALSGLLLLSLNAFGANGRVEGVVTEASGGKLGGAIVRLNGREVTAGRDGRFVFASVPEGTHTLSVDYLGAAAESREIVVRPDQTTVESFRLAASGANIENILVIGQVASKSSSLNQQRAADNIINVIASDAIGQLPDANVSEALQRAPGVFIERDQGEGRFVGFRGIAPDLNVTTINGINLPAPENNRRAVALDVVPSDILEGLVIAKTLTPDMDGNAIGGSVDVKGLSAFDREGRTFNMTGEASYNDLEEQTSPKLGLTYTDTFGAGGDDDVFGVAASISWFDRDFGSDNIETDGGWPSDLETVGGAEFKGAEEIERRNYIITRERFGAALNFDWRVSEFTQLHWRNLVSEFSDDEQRTRVEHKFDDGDAIAGSATSATWEGAEMDRDFKDRLEEQTIFSSVVGGQTQLTEAWLLDYNVGYSRSDEEEPNRQDTDFAGEGFTLGYDSIGARPNLTASADSFDPANFELDEIVIENNLTEDEESSFRIDATRDLNFGDNPSIIKFGVKGRYRNKTNDQRVDVYDGGFGDATLADFATGSPAYGLGEFGPGVDRSALREFFRANVGSFERNDDDSLIDSSGGNYDIDEDVLAGYAMTRIDAEALRVVLGVRYEDTEVSNRGTTVTLDDVNGALLLSETSTERSYQNWLPSLNVRYRFSDDLILRGAYFASLARPGFSDMRFGGVIEIEEDGGETELSAEIGNPDLETTEADNFDLSLEWYTGGIGLLSAGIFYKDLSDIIVLADVTDSFNLGTIAPGRVIDDAEVIQPINGNDGEIFGVELAWVQQFENLPSPWNGLLISANATFADSEATVPGRDEKIDLPLTSETTWNLSLGYESERLSLRLAGSYRDERLLELGESSEFDRVEDEHLQWDLTARYFVTDDIQVFANVINITDEPFYAFFGDSRFNSQFEEYGRTYGVGIRYSISQ